MDTNFIYQQIQQKKSFLCLGLDPDLDKIPEFLIESSKEPLLAVSYTHLRAHET